MKTSILFLCAIILCACGSLFLDPDLYPADLAPATINVYYEYTFAYKDNGNTYTFDLNDGALPIGMSISSSGKLQGTPLETGEFSFEVKLTEHVTTTTVYDDDNFLKDAVSDRGGDVQHSDSDADSASDLEWFVLVVQGEGE